MKTLQARLRRDRASLPLRAPRKRFFPSSAFGQMEFSSRVGNSARVGSFPMSTIPWLRIRTRRRSSAHTVTCSIPWTQKLRRKSRCAIVESTEKSLSGIPFFRCRKMIWTSIAASTTPCSWNAQPRETGCCASATSRSLCTDEISQKRVSPFPAMGTGACCAFFRNGVNAGGVGCARAPARLPRFLPRWA